MIGFTPARWQALKDKWAELPEQDAIWAMYIQRDSDGRVHCAPLLSGMVSTYGSELLAEDLRRDHQWRADWSQRMRDVP